MGKLGVWECPTGYLECILALFGLIWSGYMCFDGESSVALQHGKTKEPNKTSQKNALERTTKKYRN